ncbi:phage holin family protein [Streptomyces sp. 7N604]|uniref:phage holin family protein n=1 Tax=Streptomyces sp. 7N604 TaxID=3457415 RepID=UPI003FD5FEAF
MTDTSERTGSTGSTTRAETTTPPDTGASGAPADTRTPTPADTNGHRAASPDDKSVGVLVKQASEQLSDLVRSELRLAQAEMVSKGKRAGLGGGFFGGAGIMALIGLQALAATGIAAIALALPVWAAALIVTGVLFVLAAVLALLGRMQTRKAAPLKPEQAISGVRTDVEEIKERAHR